jgi:hypothetical protein
VTAPRITDIQVPHPDPTRPAPAILAAVNAVMKDVTAVGKDGFNKSQGYPFRSYDGVINVVGPALRKHGVIPSFTVTSLERRTFKYRDSGALMTESLVRVTYTLTSIVDGSTHVVAVDVPGESADSGDKGATKAVTVACRVALLQGLGIPTHDPDPDEQTHEKAAPDRPVTRKASRPAEGKPAADPGSPATSSADGLPPCPECGDPLGDHTVKRHTSGAWMHRVCPRDKKGKA